MASSAEFTSVLLAWQCYLTSIIQQHHPAVFVYIYI